MGGPSMTVNAKTMYTALCDFPGCAVESSDFSVGNNTVYHSQEALAEQFTSRFEGSLADDYGWLEVAGRHYCGDHVEWDDSGEERVPMKALEEEPDGSS